MFLTEEKRVFSELGEFLGRFLKKRGKDPPLVVTSSPIPVKDILSRHNPKKGLLLSGIAHVIVVVCVFVAGESGLFNKKPVTSSEVFIILPNNSAIYLPQTKKTGGGGGGGDRSPQPASKGNPPKFSLKQFTPPSVKIRNDVPKLAMEPSVIVPPELKQPPVSLGPLGDILGNIVLPSNGPGFGGGIGTGSGGGVGSGTGSGIGPGSDGGMGGDALGVGNGVEPPQLLKKINPEYSDEARKAKLQGTVILYVEIDTNGNVRKVLVRRGLGLRLDERAVEAVKQWKFKPGTKEDKPVIVSVIIEVIFRLL
ncbi:MAG: energy transducer TonB [Candidatus Yanofskybacteria bacterium]|nr:energy transducer TonB [Candidatus Yanofskybacteria bacterium]